MRPEASRIESKFSQPDFAANDTRDNLFVIAGLLPRTEAQIQQETLETAGLTRAVPELPLVPAK
jgi:hypothetical protein